MKIERNIEREERIFNMVKEGYKTAGRSPKVDVMGEEIGVAKSTISYYLKRLVKAGRIEKLGKEFIPLQ